MTTHKIVIKKYNNLLDIAAEWKDLTLGVFVRPEEREEGIRKMKNSIAALETYGDKIIINRDSNEHPGRPLINWLRRLLRLNKPGFGYRAISPKLIPKDFDKETAVSKLFFVEVEDL